LNRIVDLIGDCSYSFHDLSRVTLDHSVPRTPRFNMPFELGLAVAKSMEAGSHHNWFLFESRPHRLGKSLSDLDGTDPYIHGNNSEGVLRALMNVLVRRRNPPTFPELNGVYREVRAAASRLKKELRGAPLFEARAFKELVFLANDIVSRARR
jgi:hypothetical protein